MCPANQVFRNKTWIIITQLNLRVSNPFTVTLLRSMLDSTLTLIGLALISLVAKYTCTVYTPTDLGSYSTVNVPSLLSVVLTGTSFPFSSVRAMATSPVTFKNKVFASWVILYFFCRLLIFQNELFSKFFQEYHQCLTVWIQIWPDL